jgi:G2/mitotic-specific cyclin 2
VTRPDRANQGQTRIARQRVVANENDENNTRVTRAKTASLTTDELTMPSKGALQPKKTAGNVSNATNQRKRAALGDVSNVGKTDGLDGKKAAGKVGLVSKAAQPAGVQKNTVRPASRAALSTKDGKKLDAKRTGSGSGALAPVSKRKVGSTTSTGTKETSSVEDSEPARKKTLTSETGKRLQSESRVEKENMAKAAASAREEKAELEAAVKAQLPENLDDDDIDDPLMVAEYATEIFEYLRELEVKSIPNSKYMAHQDDLEWKTRGILVDWLIEVHTRFHLLPETLFLAVNIIDRFLSAKIVELERLQLVGITAMFIASKYEEVLSPHVGNFKSITDDGFSEEEILEAERFILSTLNYDLSYPNPMNFLRRVSKADNYDIQSRTIGKYLMEISLLDHRFMAYRPSHVAAGAMYLARLMLDRGEWVRGFSHVSFS